MEVPWGSPIVGWFLINVLINRTSVKNMDDDGRGYPPDFSETSTSKRIHHKILQQQWQENASTSISSGGVRAAKNWDKVPIAMAFPWEEDGHFGGTVPHNYRILQWSTDLDDFFRGTPP